MGGDRQDRPLTGDPEFLHDHVRPRGRAATLGWTHQEVGKDSGRDWWLHRVRPSAVRVAELADLPGGKGPARAHTGRESPDARSGPDPAPLANPERPGVVGQDGHGVLQADPPGRRQRLRGDAHGGNDLPYGWS